MTVMMGELSTALDEECRFSTTVAVRGCWLVLPLCRGPSLLAQGCSRVQFRWQGIQSCGLTRAW